MNFNEAKFLIVDHFDSVINQIDINIETLLCDTGLNDQDRKSLSDIREKQLEQIDEVQQASLSELNQLSEKDFENEFAQLINDSSLNSEEKIRKVLSRFILNDFFLIEQQNIMSRHAICMIPGFFDKKNGNLLKYLFSNYAF